MSTGSPKASPSARRVAEALGVDLTAVTGTGPGGRVRREDVEAVAHGAASAPGATVGPAAHSPADTSTVQPLTSVEKVVARRMAESRSSVPEFELHVEVDMEAAVALRAALKGASPQGEPVPSLNDMCVRASALALRRHPRANASFRDEGFLLHGRVNVGLAVASRDGLAVPVVPDADEKALGAIAQETRELARRGRDGRLTPADLDGGTFTVSNLGMFGVRSFTAVINVPQAAILAVGALERRPVVEGDAVVPRHVMDVTLCCDHRILDGAAAAAFLAELRSNLEVPERLL